MRRNHSLTLGRYGRAGHNDRKHFVDRGRERHSPSLSILVEPLRVSAIACHRIVHRKHCTVAWKGRSPQDRRADVPWCIWHARQWLPLDWLLLIIPQFSRSTSGVAIGDSDVTSSNRAVRYRQWALSAAKLWKPNGFVVGEFLLGKLLKLLLLCFNMSMNDN